MKSDLLNIRPKSCSLGPCGKCLLVDQGSYPAEVSWFKALVTRCKLVQCFVWFIVADVSSAQSVSCNTSNVPVISGTK